MGTERIENCIVLRTGWTTEERRCPVHGCALELTLDETDYSTWSKDHQVPFNHNDNRLRWRCDSCVGSWTENYFQSAGVAEPRSRLLLSCPACGGNRVTHTCVPACCDEHVCVDCGIALTPQVSVVSSGTLRRVAESKIDTNLSVSVSGPPAIQSGIRRDFRQCPIHSKPLELVFLRLYQETPQTLLGWYCSTCDRTWTEPHFRANRREFIPDSTPGVVCPVCAEQETSSDDEGRVRCLSCGSELKISLVPT